MQDFKFNNEQPMLVEIYERLRSLNSDTQHILGEHFALQQNQLASLEQLGFIVSEPKASVTGSGGTTSSEKQLPILTKFLQEVEKVFQNQEIFRQQIEGARFISDALYRQGVPQKESTGMDKEDYAQLTRTSRS